MWTVSNPGSVNAVGTFDRNHKGKTKAALENILDTLKNSRITRQKSAETFK